MAKLGERGSVEPVVNESRRGAHGNTGARFRDGGRGHGTSRSIRRKGGAGAMLSADVAGRRDGLSLLVVGAPVRVVAMCAVRGYRLLLVTAGAKADRDAREGAQRHQGHQDKDYQYLQPGQHEKHYDMAPGQRFPPLALLLVVGMHHRMPPAASDEPAVHGEGSDRRNGRRIE